MLTNTFLYAAIYSTGVHSEQTVIYRLRLYELEHITPSSQVSHATVLYHSKPEPIGIDFVFGNITFVRKSGRAYRAGIRPNHTILFVDELSCMGGFNGSSPCRDQDIVNFIHRSSGDIEITIIPTAVLSELLRDIDYVPPIPNTQLQSDDEL
ncbi:hypothetical protein SARC_14122 [Sphaeroforma arctica JP610]|uniref:Uncharacterized protein n=1 Tax=Sphaeroforma arctica JP610 TaxID=667725 RepID=A0A0L0F9B7_9EUKA|nr:hypothetical protein SARC_14122 [Sphaeroforma arctica JP610]KNC73319.1 hypothetical protein SARC_14122 [Sphaeroforma arctica JP610]|eukprot:XP_014147221.1 hypothetical protein SARC_14122 [Sphaeroforma arctica JP610]